MPPPPPRSSPSSLLCFYLLSPLILPSSPDVYLDLLSLCPLSSLLLRLLLPRPSPLFPLFVKSMRISHSFPYTLAAFLFPSSSFCTHSRDSFFPPLLLAATWRRANSSVSSIISLQALILPSLPSLTPFFLHYLPSPLLTSVPFTLFLISYPFLSSSLIHLILSSSLRLVFLLLMFFLTLRSCLLPIGTGVLWELFGCCFTLSLNCLLRKENIITPSPLFLLLFTLHLPLFLHVLFISPPSLFISPFPSHFPSSLTPYLLPNPIPPSCPISFSSPLPLLPPLSVSPSQQGIR